MRIGFIGLGLGEKNVPMARLERDNSRNSLVHNKGDPEWAALAKVAARRARRE
ncbi:hypothetical protein [Erwinia sp. JUb26]|uniref:hypothetical protein n=1 Tax=Erwinia sp. JUb26 TaxID=2485126 RepID=UPI000F93E691|nr:hypothetical protein [Erwinia sp. JUb26]ROR07583.1 hypothetical protein EC836_10612 [Erwinia sp. JUb26]